MRGDPNPHPALPKAPAPPAPWWVRLLRRPWPPVEVVLLKTARCSLCDRALSLLRRKERSLGLRLRVVDIEAEPELLGVFGHQVPVVFVAGRRRFWGTVDPVLLEREVAAARRQPASGGPPPL